MLEFLNGAYWPVTLIFLPILVASVAIFFYYFEDHSNPTRQKGAALIGAFAASVLLTVWSAPLSERDIKFQKSKPPVSVIETYENCLPAGASATQRMDCIKVANAMLNLQELERAKALAKLPAPSKLTAPSKLKETSK